METLKKMNKKLVEALKELNGAKPRHPTHPDSTFSDRTIYNKAYKRWVKINNLIEQNLKN